MWCDICHEKMGECSCPCHFCNGIGYCECEVDEIIGKECDSDQWKLDELSATIMRKNAMRDPARIKETLAVLEKLWNKYPDQRLGQLVLNYSRQRRRISYDHLFNMEDEILLRNLKTHLGNP